MVTVTVTAAIRLVGLPLEIVKVKVKVKFLETVVLFIGASEGSLSESDLFPVGGVVVV